MKQFFRSFLNIVFLAAFVISSLSEPVEAQTSGNVSTVVGSLECVTAPPNMVTWWDADTVNGTTAADISGNNDDALMNGAAVVLGKVGKSFEFDGSSYMEANGSIINGLHQLTIDMWVKPS